ncbi:hypothetical protein CHGG_09427 [Chaetomium globosum CBS 148.51]|uniref:Uncharacterized protein n=1 Tax=Chaetomium globosum (strain ATCC 6205 / CBS 148.51 / DSM 1962 / NBRC 6347 / NRRL 1970) TaxID=306901 RepID=Q2GRH7_CHAGB|nr:uncharacterized protein CHGG_09427 [Chaetomium globosum CBS 148.51]EAQ85413.1 hypothetical protein CHGG_09427 [Chaetomium globosum CBS 148.51]
MVASQFQKVQIIQAPSRSAIVGELSVFLAGTTTKSSYPDWRQALIEAVSHLPITVLNPLRLDWDHTWGPEQISAQVEWELDMQELADVVIVFFGPETDAPISLLELGLSARSGKAIVACHRDYTKRVNVEIVCRRFGLEFIHADVDLAESVIKKGHESIEAIPGQALKLTR